MTVDQDSVERAFAAECRANAARMAADPVVRESAASFVDASAPHKYTYNFTWLGRPIIQYPQDIVAIQEILWKTRPDFVVETGVAHGGSLVLHASILELLGGDRRAIGIDIDIRPHNRSALEAHPLAERLTLIEGSSIDETVVEEVRNLIPPDALTVVILDSYHTHEHVARELALYSPLVTRGSYLIVLDTVIESMLPEAFADRPWGPGDNPYTAVQEFLRANHRFQIDREYDEKLGITVAPRGYLQCVV